MDKSKQGSTLTVSGTLVNRITERSPVIRISNPIGAVQQFSPI